MNMFDLNCSIHKKKKCKKKENNTILKNAVTQDKV